MNPNFTFDAEGVFDQPIKPLRFRKRTKRVRTNRYAAEIAQQRDNVRIKQTMRGPKLLSASMPRVILKDDYLQRPRSPESEFGLKFVPPALRKELADFVGWSVAAHPDDVSAAAKAEVAFFREKRGSGFRKLVNPRLAPTPACKGHGVVVVREFA